MNYSKYTLMIVLIISLLVGCSSKEDLSLDSKHAELPDYVLSTPELVQETYVMAAQNTEILATVPCFCGCGEGAGHMSNLDCFVKNMDSENAVTEWDPHGTAWDICVQIAREAVEMKQDGKEDKEIYSNIVKKYESFGTPTPTSVPN